MSEPMMERDERVDSNVAAWRTSKDAYQRAAYWLAYFSWTDSENFEELQELSQAVFPNAAWALVERLAGWDSVLDTDDGWRCCFCHRGMEMSRDDDGWIITHADDCLWLQARALVEAGR